LEAGKSADRNVKGGKAGESRIVLLKPSETATTESPIRMLQAQILTNEK